MSDDEGEYGDYEDVSDPGDMAEPLEEDFAYVGDDLGGELGGEIVPTGFEYNPATGEPLNTEQTRRALYVDLQEDIDRLDLYDRDRDDDATAAAGEHRMIQDSTIDVKQTKLDNFPEITDPIFKSVVLTASKRRDYINFFKRNKNLYMIEDMADLFRIDKEVKRKIVELIIRYMTMRKIAKDSSAIPPPLVGELPSPETAELTFQVLKHLFRKAGACFERPLEQINSKEWYKRKLDENRVILDSFSAIQLIGIPNAEQLERFRKEFRMERDRMVFPVLGRGSETTFYIGFVDPAHTRDNVARKLLTNAPDNDMNRITPEQLAKILELLYEVTIDDRVVALIDSYFENVDKQEPDKFHPLVDTIYNVLRYNVLAETSKINPLSEKGIFDKFDIPEESKSTIVDYFEFTKGKKARLGPKLLRAFRLGKEVLRDIVMENRFEAYKWDIDHPLVRLLTNILVESKYELLAREYDINRMTKEQLRTFIRENFTVELNRLQNIIIEQYYAQKGIFENNRNHPLVQFVIKILGDWDEDNMMAVGTRLRDISVQDLTTRAPQDIFEALRDVPLRTVPIPAVVSQYTKISRFEVPTFRKILKRVREKAVRKQGRIPTKVMFEYWVPKLHFVTGTPVHVKKREVLKQQLIGNYVYVKLDSREDEDGNLLYYNRVFVDPLDYIKAWENTYRRLRLEAYSNAGETFDRLLKTNRIAITQINCTGGTDVSELNQKLDEINDRIRILERPIDQLHPEIEIGEDVKGYVAQKIEHKEQIKKLKKRVDRQLVNQKKYELMVISHELLGRELEANQNMLDDVTITSEGIVVDRVGSNTNLQNTYDELYRKYENELKPEELQESLRETIDELARKTKQIAELGRRQTALRDRLLQPEPDTTPGVVRKEIAALGVPIQKIMKEITALERMRDDLRHRISAAEILKKSIDDLFEDATRDDPNKRIEEIMKRGQEIESQDVLGKWNAAQRKIEKMREEIAQREQYVREIDDYLDAIRGDIRSQIAARPKQVTTVSEELRKLYVVQKELRACMEIIELANDNKVYYERLIESSQTYFRQQLTIRQGEYERAKIIYRQDRTEENQWRAKELKGTVRKLSSYLNPLEPIQLGMERRRYARSYVPVRIDGHDHITEWNEMKRWIAAIKSMARVECITQSYGIVMAEHIENEPYLRDVISDIFNYENLYTTAWPNTMFQYCKELFATPMYISTEDYVHTNIVVYHRGVFYRYEPLGWATKIYHSNVVDASMEKLANHFSAKYVPPNRYCPEHGPQGEISVPFSGDYAMVFLCVLATRKSKFDMSAVVNESVNKRPEELRAKVQSMRKLFVSTKK